MLRQPWPIVSAVSVCEQLAHQAGPVQALRAHLNLHNHQAHQLKVCKRLLHAPSCASQPCYGSEVQQVSANASAELFNVEAQIK
jgi:hypothetical protein